VRKPEPWAVTWMRMAHVIASRSKDPSFQAGAVLVAEDNKTFLGLGFNGPSPRSSDDFDWKDRSRKHAVVSHAESNCLWFAADAHGLRQLAGSILYVNGRPCHDCVREAVRAGVGDIIYAAGGPQPRMVDADEWAKSELVAKDGGVWLVPYTVATTTSGSNTC
jgi:deoxycytidylate deaminase